MKIMHNVPQILQNPELPNGCEITSLCQLLHFYGFEADKCDLADNYLPQSENWYGADPEKVYMGNPRLDDASPETGYYCFQGPIVSAANKYLQEHNSSLQAYSLHDLSEDDLEDLLISGYPFIFWASLRFNDIGFDPAPAWKLPEGRMHKAFHTLHCMVCKGCDDNYFYIADPLDLNKGVERKQFMKIYRQLGSRSVIIRSCI